MDGISPRESLFWLALTLVLLVVVWVWAKAFLTHSPRPRT